MVKGALEPLRGEGFVEDPLHRSHVKRACRSDEPFDGFACAIRHGGRRRAGDWHGNRRGTGRIDEPGDVRACRQDLIGRLGGADPLHLDQMAHCDQACDRVVVIQPVASRRALRVDDAVAPFPDPDRGNAQSTTRGGLLDGVHGLFTITHCQHLTSHGQSRYSLVIPLTKGRQPHSGAADQAEAPCTKESVR